MAVTEPPDEPDVDVADLADIDSIAIDRCPTKPMERHQLSLEMDIGNPEAVAAFLEAMATAIRLKRRIKLIIE